MRIVFFLAAFLISLFNKGQNYLTNGQVYNYDVGDVIQAESNSTGQFGPTGPPTYSTQTILSKTITANNDSLIYSIKVHKYMPPACQSCTSAPATTSTLTQMYTNLNAKAAGVNIADTNFWAFKDTLYTDNCNRSVYKRIGICKSFCMDKKLRENYFVAGCGGAYYQDNVPQLTTGQLYLLTAYVKQTGSCGTITYLNERSPTNIKVKAFPNPSNGKITFSSSVALRWFTAYSINGEICSDGKIENDQINLSQLKSGIYIVKVLDENNTVSTVKVVKD